jgi:hypothetical protein
VRPLMWSRTPYAYYSRSHVLGAAPSRVSGLVGSSVDLLLVGLAMDLTLSEQAEAWYYSNRVSRAFCRRVISYRESLGSVCWC